MLPSKILPLLFLLLLGINSCLSGKILVLSFYGSKSHKITYMRLIEELATRGHEITVVTPIKPLKIVPNIKEIFHHDLEAGLLSKFDPLKNRVDNKSFIETMFEVYDEMGQMCENFLRHEEVQGLTKEEWDLIFIQPAINECALGLAYRLKAPLVLWSVVGVTDYLTAPLGSRLPSSFIPHPFMDSGPEMNFFKRFINFGINFAFDNVWAWVMEPAAERIYRRVLGDDIPSCKQILGNASILLSNSHFSLSGPRPYLPNIIDVGGIHSHPAKPLPPKLEAFVNKSGSEGFIYFSMGTLINTNTMPEEKRNIFISVFKKLEKKYQIVWKWGSGDIPGKSGNVLTEKWLPQQDLLGHPKIKLFITHCGLGGTEEAIYHGVPMLGLPIFGDQHLNAKQGRNMGILDYLMWAELNEEDLFNGIMEIIDNSKYKENVDKISATFRDQPDDPLERGVYWMEYVMRHKGAEHLKSPARHLNYFQYHCWDIVLAYLFLICSLLFIIWKVLLVVTRAFLGLFRTGKSKKE